MDCIWVILKNVGPPFFKVISFYIKMLFTAVISSCKCYLQLENHSQLLCGRDFANEKTLALPIWRFELIINKIKQNYLK